MSDDRGYSKHFKRGTKPGGAKTALGEDKKSTIRNGDRVSDWSYIISSRQNISSISGDFLVFSILLIIGGFVIFSANDLGVGMIATISFNIAIVFSYAAFAKIKVQKGGSLNREQAGDNCYYLGFLMTLIALIATLLDLGRYGGVIDQNIILVRFSLALVTTVAGLLARIYFVQGVVELDQNEEGARASLILSMQQFHNQISAFNASLSGIATSFDGARERLDTAVTQNAKQMTETVSQSTRAMTDAISNVSDDIRSKAEAITSAPHQLEKALSDNLTSISTNAASVGAALEAMSKSVQAGQMSLGEMSNALAPMKTIGSDLSEMSPKIADVESKFSSLSEKLEQLNDLLKEENEPANGTATVVANMRNSADAMKIVSNEIGQFGDNLSVINKTIGSKDGVSSLEVLFNSLIAVSDKAKQLTIPYEKHVSSLEESRENIASEREAVLQLRKELQMAREEAQETVKIVYRELGTLAQFIIHESKKDRDDGGHRNA